MALSKRHIVLTFTGLCFLNIITALDATSLGVAVPTIATSIHADTTQAYWSGTSFILASAVCQPIFASFSNAFGRKPIVLLALTLFVAGTIICGTSRGVPQMLSGRTIQGAGGGGLLAMTYLLIADLLPLRSRSKGMSVISLVWLLGTITGPILGGGFSASASWRWLFWISLPFAAIGFVLVTMFLRTPHKSLAPVQALKKVDWVGALLFVGGLTSFLVAISGGGSMYAWSSWQTLVPLIVGAVGLLAWVTYEHFVPEAPILPLVILSNRTANASYFGTFCSGLIQFALLYYLPLFYQVSKGYSPIISGVAMLPQCVLSGPSSAFTGGLIAKTGRYKHSILIGWAILALGCGILVLLDSGTTTPQLIFINAVSGIGLGITIVAQPIAVQAATAESNIAVASGLTPFFRAIGQALGIVISSAIFQNALKGRLLASTSALIRQHAVEYSADAASLAVLVDNMAEGSTEKAEIIAAFDQSIHIIWWCLFAFALAAGIFSLAMKELSLGPAQVDKTDVVSSLEEAKTTDGMSVLDREDTR